VSAPAPAASGRDGAPRKLSWKEQREVETLETRIAALEQRKESLTEAMNQCGDDYVRLQTLSTEVDATNAELEEALERWFALAEILEQS
jgi:ATP-binding cassette subfamily F protein uup